MRIFTNYLENPTTCRGLYCVWVPNREKAATPLVARWIDPQAAGKDASSSDLPVKGPEQVGTLL